MTAVSDRKQLGCETTPMPRPRLRIVHVVGQLVVGGMEKLLVEFARHTDRGRFDLHFVALNERGKVADELEALGWPVTELRVGDGFHVGLYIRLARLFRRLNADVVHTHNSRPLIYAGLAARLAGVKRVIHTRHGQRFGASRRTTAVFRMMTRLTDRVVCVSHDSARLTEEEGVAARRIVTVLNGIDTERFFITPRAARGPVVAVGRLSAEKDFATLIRAAAVAWRADPTFRLEIAGDGTCAEELRLLIQELGIGDAARLLGEIHDVPELLARGSVFALSSLTEGISLSIMEAMAAGLPVVATRVGGNPEVVKDGETGLLVPAGDAEALAAALLKLWRDAGLRREMGPAGRARIEAHFDVRRMVASYEELYRGNCPA